MPENTVFTIARTALHTLLKVAMAGAVIVLILMAINMYNGYTSRGGLDTVPTILMVIIPMVLFALAFYAHQKLKID